MFTTTGLFKSIPCPRAEECEALNCIFSHDPQVLLAKKPEATGQTSAKQSTHKTDYPEPAPKRRKVDGIAAFTPSLSSIANAAPVAPPGSSVKADSNKLNGSTKTIQPGLPQTLKKTITPPTKTTQTPSTSAKKTVAVNGTKAKSQATTKETLNPRMLASAPTGHDKRTLYLRYLHEQMKRLNDLVSTSDRPDKDSLYLDEQELIKTSLDEEKQLAFDNPTVYGNVIKQRIGKYKKMSLEDWITHVKTKVFAARQPATKDKSVPKAIVTNLTAGQEVKLLADLGTSEDTLTKLGFVLTPPTSKEIEDREFMVAQCARYEVCDRCKTRFQVFPSRRETDGVLTTNGPCVHHWGKMRYPKREKTDKITGSKDPVYICCGEFLNAPGCTTSDSHVFKMVEPARMASVMQFVHTPENAQPKKDPKGRPVKAVTFDCEMGYTVYGLELIRLTAVTWPDGEELIDVLVQPKGTILDFNTRFSGVDAETFKQATTWTSDMPPLPINDDTTLWSQDKKPKLPLVPGPELARAIFCSYITPSTPLIGHALENDMNSIRLCHPVIVDTIALYPHPKGLPIRYGLKQLTLTYLGRDIQTGGAAGHDSLEDARATGDLVRVKVGKTWEGMEKKGWRWNGEELVGPGEQDGATGAAS